MDNRDEEENRTEAITPNDNKDNADWDDADPSDMSKVSACLLYTSPSPRDGLLSRMPSSA